LFGDTVFFTDAHDARLYENPNLSRSNEMTFSSLSCDLWKISTLGNWSWRSCCDSGAIGCEFQCQEATLQSANFISMHAGSVRVIFKRDVSTAESDRIKWILLRVPSLKLRKGFWGWFESAVWAMLKRWTRLPCPGACPLWWDCKHVSGCSGI